MWSNPESTWDGFKPVGYLLEAGKVLALPVVRTEKGAMNSSAVGITFAEVLRQIANQQVTAVETGGNLGHGNTHQTTIWTEAEPLVFSGVPFHCQLLKTLIDLQTQGVKPFDATWFWYDRASVLDDPHDSYAFFVVHDNRIVNERVKFSDAHNYGFDPSVFDAGDTSDIWNDDRGWRDAEARFWYRTFYRETFTGQLMVLRSDEPELFHYPEGGLVRRLFPPQPDIDVIAQLQAAFSALERLEKK